MSGETSPAPLDLRSVFARPWAGSAALWRPWWLRWLPLPSRFEFRTEIVDPGESSWGVRDTTTFPDGSVQVRAMRCARLPDGRLRLAAEDMPGGAVVTPRADGFDFSAYTIRTPVIGPLRVPLRFSDTVQIEPDGTMGDEIEMRWPGLRVGKVSMRLRPAPAGSA